MAVGGDQRVSTPWRWRQSATAPASPSGPTRSRSLQQRIAERTSSAALQPALLRAMQSVPHATGLAIAQLAGGIRRVLVIGADGEAFATAERAAMDRLREVRYRFRDLTVDLVCVPASQADAIELPSAMEVYRYTRSSSAAYADQQSRIGASG